MFERFLEFGLNWVRDYVDKYGQLMLKKFKNQIYF